MSLNENLPINRYYPNTSPKLSKSSNFFYTPISPQDDKLLLSENTLPIEINKKTDEITHMFNSRFGKSFLNIKPRALITFENQLKNCLLSPNSKILNRIPWLYKKILEEQRLKEENLKKKINLGSMVYYSFRDGKKKQAINIGEVKEKYLIHSSNFSSSDTKDIINQAFTKVKFWDKNAKRVSKILDRPILRRNSLARLSKISKYKSSEIISSNRNNDSQETINSLFSNFRQSKNMNNNIKNEQDESLIKETIKENENSILSEDSAKNTTVKIDKNNTNSYTNTKSNSNNTNNNIKNKNDTFTNTNAMNCFADTSNCESLIKSDKKKFYNKIKNERNNNILISNYKSKISKTSNNFFNRYYNSYNESVSKKSKPLIELINDKNYLDNNSPKDNMKYFMNINNLNDDTKNSEKYLLNIYNRNTKTINKNSFRNDSRNRRTIYNNKNNFNTHNFSYKINDTINEQINNLSQYVKSCNNKLIKFVERSDKILIKLSKSINKETKDKNQTNLQLLLSDKKLKRKKRNNKTSQIKLLVKNAKKQIGVEDTFDVNFNNNRKTKRKNARINKLTKKMIEDLNLDINDTSSREEEL